MRSPLVINSVCSYFRPLSFGRLDTEIFKLKPQPNAVRNSNNYAIARCRCENRLADVNNEKLHGVLRYCTLNCRKRSCHILQMEEVFTCWAQYVSSPSGNVALASVLRLKTNAYSLETSPRQRGNPVIIINCHLETGYSANQIKVRVSQSLVMMKEAKRIYTEIKTRFPTSIPNVMITGDMNTGNQLPASTSFLDNIYVDVLLVSQLRESGTGTDTFFYPVPFLIPGLGV
uniref:uncharacterized protein LOC120339384 isoform X2 n=1 Tax=Styela clava TaxID=7725 RepID=UPI001939C60F|nr:uncharacterized protein LOC120339384 isoform X2 [Styela clava]